MNILNPSTFMIIFWFSISRLISTHSNNYDEYINEFVVRCPGGYSEAKSVATQMGFVLHHKMMGFDDFYVFKHKSNIDKMSMFHTNRLRRSLKVDWVEQQVLLKRVKRDLSVRESSIKFIDPLYDSQWYLMRSMISSAQTDMNVIEAWKMGYSGKGVVISILDDGIDYRHEDLRDNYDPSASYDINGNDNDPLPNLNNNENRHGTRCAGEVSARANNSKCGVGVAFNSKIGAIRMLDGDVTDRVEAEALSFKQQHIDIYSGSWGPDDSGRKVEGPAILAKSAFEKGTKYGRNGLGNIYVWASGNGGKKKDSCACDGYASSIFTISISSVSEYNRKPWYLESCASTLASTYSSGSSNEKKIISTDLNDQCATDHTGTSASAPLAAGIIALLIEANRNLTWRDVQYIIVMTSNPHPFVNGQFIVNGANRKVSNLYGFGLMDTGKMVRLGRLWYNLPPQHVCTLSENSNKIYLKDRFKVEMSSTTHGCQGNSRLNYIEHVVLFLNIEYQRRGDLQVHLISPSGTRSEILPYRPYDHSFGPTTFDIWPLVSVQFWGESASGSWSVEINNYKSANKNYIGLWSSFQMEIYGTDKWPIRLKKPASQPSDNWFQQFERFVVEKIDDDNVKWQIPVVVRGHADTSHDDVIVKNVECDEQCFNNTCSGPGPQYCHTCKHFQTSNGVCVPHCHPGSYLNNNTKICELCHFTCDECLGPGKFNCSRCHVGDLYITKSRQCRMSNQNCRKGSFKDVNSCNKCPNHCSVCTSKTVCSECDQPFVLTLESQCRKTCGIGSYVDSRKRCRVCHVNCLSCVQGDSSSCTSCDHNSFLYTLNNRNGKCVKECPNGYFTNNTVRSCYRCHPNCKTCTGPSSGMCTDCVPPMELSVTGHTCIDPVSYNCKPSEFKSATGTCEKCSVECLTCSENRCTSCPANKLMFNHSCVSRCPSDHFPYYSLNKCLSCQEYCNSCNNSVSFNECSHCSANKTNCNHNCNKIQYWDVDSKNCEKCDPSCATCRGSTDRNCTSCSQKNYHVSFGRCLKICPQGSYSLKLSDRTLCVPCHQSCKNSSCNSDNGNCVRCPYGHRLSITGICERIITCPISEYWQYNQKMCLKCDHSCRSCSQNGFCTSCPNFSCLDAFSSTCRPCCESLYVNKNCSKCQFGRELCVTDDQIVIPSLLIFRYPVRIVILMAIIFTMLFLLILLYFYTGDIAMLFKYRYIKDPKSFVKYRKLQTFPSILENSDEIFSSDDDNTSHERAQSKNPTVSFTKSVLLEVVEEKNFDENTEWVSSKRLPNNANANGHTNVES